MNAMETRPIVLEGKGLVKQFGGLIAVNQVDIKVHQGEVLGLIGPNGAGKSTLFNLLSGALRSNQGQITLFGKDTTSYPAHRVCQLGLARTFQIVRPLKKLSVRDNVMIGALARTDSVSDARQQAEGIIDQVGLRTYADHPSGTLSLANLKRMEVARALATQPRILLLDEVMAGLNSAELTNFIEMVRGLNQSGLTLVIVEHVIEAVVSLCERVIVMSYGQKIADATPTEVLENQQVVDAYLGDYADVA